MKMGSNNIRKGTIKAIMFNFIAWKAVRHIPELALEQATNTAGQFGGVKNMDIET